MDAIVQINSPLEAVEIIEGNCDRESYVAAFQYLINRGIVWSLQGWYGRTANQLIRDGVCYPPGNADRDD